MYSLQRVLLVIGCVLCFGILKHLWDNQSAKTGSAKSQASKSHSYRAGNLTDSRSRDTAGTKASSNGEWRSAQACKALTGLDDIVIILKTGSTEIYEKLPIHLATTFACSPTFAIYSDLQQSFGPLQVRDALALVSNETQNASEEFAQYDVLRQHVLDGGDAAQLKGEKSWRLDKWKFLPMISNAWSTFGASKKWYIFIEADTYLSLHNLLLWLRKLDPQKAIYSGAQVMIGDTEFAHGGSGFLLSAKAAQAFAYEIEKNQRK